MFFFFIRCRKMCFLPFPFSRRYFFVPNLWPMMIIDFYRIIIRRIFEESFLSAAILSNYRIMMEWVCTRYIPLHIGWKEKATSIFERTALNDTPWFIYNIESVNFYKNCYNKVITNWVKKRCLAMSIKSLCHSVCNVPS